MTRTPNFICVGAQKAGTTTLHDILKQHPQIYLAENKEAHFFSKKENLKKGLDWWWETYFHRYNNEKIIGVMTPEYLFMPEVPQLIYNEFGPNIKILGILRHPVDRAFSHYLMTKSRGDEPLSFEEAIKAESYRIRESELNLHSFSYMSRGHYSEQVKRYIDLFPRENLLWLSYEKDIRINLEVTVQRILRFLNVEELILDSNIQSNPATEPKSINLNQLIKNKVVSSIARTILPKSARTKIRQTILKLNSKQISQEKKTLSPELKNELFDLYFSAEPAQLQALTEIDFSYWSQTKKVNNS